MCETMVAEETSIDLEPAKFDPAKHNGMLSIQSMRTGDWRTFKISTKARGNLKGKRILSLLTGPNREDWTNWLGFAFVNEDGTIKLWGKFRDSGMHAIFADMVARPKAWESKAVYRIEGRCRRCNRPLTVPESVDSGLGPECRKKI